MVRMVLKSSHHECSVFKGFVSDSISVVFRDTYRLLHRLVTAETSSTRISCSGLLWLPPIVRPPARSSLSWFTSKSVGCFADVADDRALTLQAGPLCDAEERAMSATVSRNLLSLYLTPLCRN